MPARADTHCIVEIAEAGDGAMNKPNLGRHRTG